MDHILAHCAYAREVWHRCFDALQVNVQVPNTEEKFTEWWLLQRGRFLRKVLRGFDSFIIATAWALWKQRNARFFNRIHQQRTPPELVQIVLAEIKEWKLAGIGAGRLDPFVRE